MRIVRNAYPAVMPRGKTVLSCARAITESNADMPIAHTLLSDHSQRLAAAFRFAGYIYWVFMVHQLLCGKKIEASPPLNNGFILRLFWAQKKTRRLFRVFFAWY